MLCQKYPTMPPTPAHVVRSVATLLSGTIASGAATTAKAACDKCVAPGEMGRRCFVAVELQRAVTTFHDEGDGHVIELGLVKRSTVPRSRRPPQAMSA